MRILHVTEETSLSLYTHGIFCGHLLPSFGTRRDGNTLRAICHVIDTCILKNTLSRSLFS